MAVASYDVLGLTGGLLKRFYLPKIREQLNNKTVLLKRLQRNTDDIQGGVAYVALHTGRNVGTGARPAGYSLPKLGKQTHAQSSTELKYNYGRFYVSGPDINKTKGNKGAFAKIVDNEVQGLVSDLKLDINRQLFADGSGILCFATTASSTTDTSGTAAVTPYLWDPATRFISGRDAMEYGLLDFSGSYNAYIPAETDTAAAAPYVVDSTTTSTKGSDCTLGWAIASGGTSFGVSDAVTKWRAGALNVSNTFVRREMMGLDGIIAESDLPGDASWYYGSNANALGTWATATNTTTRDISFASGVNLLQGIADSNSYWRANVDDNNTTPRALTLGMMDAMWGKLTVEKDAMTSLILTTYFIQNKYADLLRADRRFVNTMTLDGGFTGLEYNGKPIVADRDCPTGRMYFVDESELSLFVGEDFNWIEDGGGSVLHYISGYDAFEAVLRYYAELGCHRRNVQGKIIDILES